MVKKFLIEILYKSKPKNLLLTFYEIFSKFNANPNIVGLKINKKTPLADLGEIIYLPFDKYITWWVIKEAEYKHFLLNHIVEIKKDILFIDIGANCGLVSRQVYNLKNNKAKIYCFEPDLNNYHCLKLNVGSFANCFNFGLGNKEGKKRLYKFNSNHGMSSLIKKEGFDKIELIKIKNINSEINKILINKRNNQETIIKFDTEGYDLYLLSILDKNILNKIECICFEYQNVNNFKFNKSLLIKNLKYFNQILSNDREKYDIEDIVNLKLNKQIDFILKK